MVSAEERVWWKCTKQRSEKWSTNMVLALYHCLFKFPSSWAMNQSWENWNWSAERHYPGFVVVMMGLTSCLVCQSFFVLSPYWHPVQKGGVTLANESGISSSSASSLRTAKLVWPRWWVHLKRFTLGSLATRWWVDVSTAGSKSMVKGPQLWCCAAWFYLHSPQ